MQKKCFDIVYEEIKEKRAEREQEDDCEEKDLKKKKINPLLYKTLRGVAPRLPLDFGILDKTVLPMKALLSGGAQQVCRGGRKQFEDISVYDFSIVWRGIG